MLPFSCLHFQLNLLLGFGRFPDTQTSSSKGLPFSCFLVSVLTSTTCTIFWTQATGLTFYSLVILFSFFFLKCIWGLKAQDFDKRHHTKYAA